MNDIIPADALRSLEEQFGTRFVRHNAGEEASDAEDAAAWVYPQSVEEVESLARLAARHSIPLAARGAGTAIYPGDRPRGITVRFDAMRRIRMPEGESWVEVEPGATWWALGERLGESGMGPRVYPTSAPRSTVGGWPKTVSGWAPTSTVGCFRTSWRSRSSGPAANGAPSKAPKP